MVSKAGELKSTSAKKSSLCKPFYNLRVMQSHILPWPHTPNCMSVKHYNRALTHFIVYFSFEENKLVVKMLLQVPWSVPSAYGQVDL